MEDAARLVEGKDWEKRLRAACKERNESFGDCDEVVWKPWPNELPKNVRTAVARLVDFQEGGHVLDLHDMAILVASYAYDRGVTSQR